MLGPDQRPNYVAGDPSCINALNLREPAVRQAIPTLETALKRWEERDDDTDLIWREITLGPSQIPLLPTKLIYQWMVTRNVPFRLLAHESLATLPEKTSYLETVSANEGLGPITPVRTFTLGIRTGEGISPVAITTLERDVDKDVRREIGEDLDLSNKTMKGAIINPRLPQWDARVALGVSPGIVGPFVSPTGRSSVQEWYYLKGGLAPDAQVEIAVSYLDSLVLPKQSFEELLGEYHKRYLGREIKVLPSK